MGFGGAVNEVLDCGARIKSIIFCTFCLGPCFVIVAIVMFVLAAKDPRGHNIAKYNTAIDKWTGGEYERFAGLNVSYGVWSSGVVVLPLVSDSSPDTINDHDKRIHAYSQYLKYSNEGRIFPPSVRGVSQSFDVINTITGQITEASVKVVRSTYDTPSNLGCTYSCGSSGNSRTCVNDLDCYSTCNIRNGYYDYFYENCYYIQYLEEVGIEVQTDGSFGPGNNVAFQSYGARQPDDSSGSSSGTFYPTSFTVSVRSMYDPYISVQRITKGTLAFGFTAKQFAAIGISFMVVGGLILTCIIGVFILAIRYTNRNKPRKNLFVSDRVLIVSSPSPPPPATPTTPAPSFNPDPAPSSNFTNLSNINNSEQSTFNPDPYPPPSSSNYNSDPYPPPPPSSNYNPDPVPPPYNPEYTSSSAAVIVNDCPPQSYESYPSPTPSLSPSAAAAADDYPPQSYQAYPSIQNNPFPSPPL